MVAAGELERLGRGLYALPSAEPTERRTLAEVARAVPAGVVCLLSALRFHDLTTQAPYEVWVAIGRKAWRPQAAGLPVRVVRMSGAALTAGVEEHNVEGVTVRVYGPAKTVADCFKFRGKVGLDVAIEALRDYWRGGGSLDELHRYAEVCRVARVMRPYVEMLVGG
jgi:predicted transcriptional regulator of viral defense system